MVLGWFEGQSAGCPRGLWSDGGCDASAAECDEGDVSVGVRGGGCDEGDGKDVGSRGVCLVIKMKLVKKAFRSQNMCSNKTINQFVII